MCFSANISFITSFGLTIIGVLSLIKSKKSELMFGAIPLLFAIQQLSEGFLWIFLRNHNNIGVSISSAVFLVFAFIIWPIWMPWSIVLMENYRVKKIFIKVLGWIGILWSFYFLITLVTNGSRAVISQGHIKYLLNISANLNQYLTGKWAILAYVLVVVLPFFISSKRGLWIFGLAGVISCIISYIFWKIEFVSIWCFFAAILSFMIYLFVSANKKHESINTLVSKN